MPTNSTHWLMKAVKYNTEGCKSLLQIYMELIIKRAQNNCIPSSQETNKIIGD